MIKFFRKIIQKLLTENKFSKYLIYAVGEIVLVVIGILIALQINNLNEQSKKEELRNGYVNSIKKDLESDIVLLEKQISQFELELKVHSNLSDRMSAPNATYDTIVKIARYEFLPFFTPSNNLNLNSYNALISSGNIDLLSRQMSQKIQSHNAEQLEKLDIIDLNFKLCAEYGYEYMNSYPINIEYTGIKGKQMNSVWAQVDENKLKTDLSGLLTIKIINYSRVNIMRTELLKNTELLIEEIEKNEK